VEPLATSRGTLGFRGTPVEKPCSRVPGQALGLWEPARLQATGANFTFVQRHVTQTWRGTGELCVLSSENVSQRYSMDTKLFSYSLFFSFSFFLPFSLVLFSPFVFLHSFAFRSFFLPCSFRPSIISFLPLGFFLSLTSLRYRHTMCLSLSFPFINFWATDKTAVVLITSDVISGNRPVWYDVGQRQNQLYKRPCVCARMLCC
jgi:hypothetical protein